MDTHRITKHLWLDAADAASLTFATGAVTQWNDKSGNARHVSQATTGFKPAYQVTGFGGLLTVSFDGVDDYLFRSNGFLYALGGACIYLVVKSSPMALNRYVLAGGQLTQLKSAICDRD